MVKFDLHIATKRQHEIIKTGLDHLSGDVLPALGKESFNFYSKPGKPAKVFLVRHQDIKLIKSITDKELIQHVGIFFGFIREKEFYLGLEGAEYIFLELNKKQPLGLKTIVLKSAAAKSFLYGNTVTNLDFKHSPKQLNRKDVIFVLNPESKFIGIGYIYKSTKRDKTVPKSAREALQLRNLVDYGYYIRRGH